MTSDQKEMKNTRRIVRFDRDSDERRETETIKTVFCKRMFCIITKQAEGEGEGREEWTVLGS